MSYCRFGWDDSQVYVYDSGDFITCCSCGLEGRSSTDFGYEDGDAESYAEACLAMVRHLRVHRRAGYVVPLYAFVGLAEDAHAWTPERVAWAIVARWRVLLRHTVCRWLDHVPVPAIGDGELPHMKCRRCQRGFGWRHDDGSVEWMGPE
jgi:hypothetical protein